VTVYLKDRGLKKFSICDPVAKSDGLRTYMKGEEELILGVSVGQYGCFLQKGFTDGGGACEGG